MALGSHFSPVPYSLIKAWSFAPQPPSTLVDISLILRHPVNQLRHAFVRHRHVDDTNLPEGPRLGTTAFAARPFTIGANTPTSLGTSMILGWPVQGA